MFTRSLCVCDLLCSAWDPVDAQDGDDRERGVDDTHSPPNGCRKHTLESWLRQEGPVKGAQTSHRSIVEIIG